MKHEMEQLRENKVRKGFDNALKSKPNRAYTNKSW